MTEKTLPFKAWKLMPSGKPVEVEIVAKSCWGSYFSTSAGQSLSPSELFESKQEAVVAGLEDCAKQQAAIDKRQKKLLKRISVLEAAKEG